MPLLNIIVLVVVTGGGLWAINRPILIGAAS